MTIPKRFSAYLEKAEEVYLSFEALMEKTGDTVTYENGKRYKLSLPYPVVLPFVYRTSPALARALGIDRTSFLTLCRARRTLLPIDRPMSEFKRENEEDHARYLKEKKEGERFGEYHPLHTFFGNNRLTRGFFETGMVGAEAFTAIVSSFDFEGVHRDLVRRRDTGLYSGCEDRIKAIEVVKRISAYDYVIDAIPIDAKTVALFQKGYDALLHDELGFWYLKLFSRIKRIEKIYKLNAPKLVQIHEYSMMIGAVEKLFGYFKEHALFPVDSPLCREDICTFVWGEDFDGDDGFMGQEDEKVEQKTVKDNLYMDDQPFLFLIYEEEEKEAFLPLLERLFDKRIRAYDLQSDVRHCGDFGTLCRMVDRIKSAHAILYLVDRRIECSELVNKAISYAATLSKPVTVIRFDPEKAPTLPFRHASVIRLPDEEKGTFVENLLTMKVVRECSAKGGN